MTITDRLRGLASTAALKVPCRVATIVNLAAMTGLLTIDGITLVTGDRVLVKDQTDPTENGIWVADTGDWDRSNDFDGNNDVVQGTMCTVIEGATNAWTAWRVTTANDIEVGSDDIDFDAAAFNDAASLYFIAAGAGAVQRTAQNKMRDIVSVADFGAVGDNATNDTAAFQAALATGKDVFVPEPSVGYRITGNLAMSTAEQVMWGQGQKAILNFTFAVATVGITITNATGWQAIRGVKLYGLVNCSKVVSIGAPDVTVEDCHIKNNTATGHGIYLEDEDVGNNIYCFDARIYNNLIYGPLVAGTYGVRLGLNHQGTKLIGNSIQHWGNLIYLNGTTTKTDIRDNILEGTTSTGTSAAIYINKNGSAMPVYGVTIEENYFEENQVCIRLDDCNHQNLIIRHNTAARNTAAKANSYFYLTGVATSAASGKIALDYNYADDYEVFLGLAGEYASKFVSLKGNQAIGVTSWASGTYAAGGYDIQTINTYFSHVLVSGALLSEGTNREESKNGVIRVPLAWTSRDYLEKVTFKLLRTGSSVTVELRSVTSEGDVDALVATSGLISVDGIATVTVGAAGDDTKNYYLQATFDNVGTSAYLYPYRAFFRR